MSAWTLRSLITPSVILCAIWLLLLGCDCQHNGSWNSVSVLWKGVGFANKGLYNQSYGFSSSHEWMWVGPYRTVSAKELILSTLVLENTLEGPLDSMIKPVNVKANQPWIFTGRTDAEDEAQTLWPPNVKNWLIVKDPDAGRQEEKRATEDEMVGWHHWLNGRESEQTPGDSERQWSLVCFHP